MTTIRITAEGNNASGKTTVLAVIQEALIAKGFKTVIVSDKEEVHPNAWEDKIAALKNPDHHTLGATIELHEKWGTIEP